MLNTKKPVYIPQYTNTAQSRGYPLHPSPEPSIIYVAENQKDKGDIEVYKSRTEEPSHLIANKTSSVSSCTIFLIIFGSIVLLAAVAAIVVSALLNSNATSSNSSTDLAVSTTIANSGTTGPTTTPPTTILTTTIVTTILTTTIATTVPTTVSSTCSNFTVSVNWNYPNNDLANASPMSFDVCCSWCLSLSTCTGFVLTTSIPKCWLKTLMSGAGSAAAGTISAVR